MKRIVIIGDLVASRKIPDRSKTQKNLQSILTRINSETKTIVSPYTITLGDEFQAVHDKSASLFQNASAVLMALHPVKVRFSIGIGTIATPINKTMAIGMDGEAFHNARTGIEEIKKTNYYLNITGISSEYAALIKQSLFLISNNISRWNKNQLSIFCELFRNTKVKDISALIGITEQAVYKSINKEEMHLIRVIMNEISEHIDKRLK